MKTRASALLVVMTAMTGLTLLLTAWWQAVGWASDLVLVRQRSMCQFYCAEVVLNYGLAWVKKEFDHVTKVLTTAKQMVRLDAGKIELKPCGAVACLVAIDRVPRDERADVVRVTVTMSAAGKMVASHRCLVERETIVGVQGQKEHRFVVHHFSFGGFG